ncbi:MAG: patatin family protein [Clostridia bacterium]|nr:patatin family protein [Clostridia bacterium]
MSRKKVGLALGGGSALGFAHIGLLQVFEQEGIPVDVISGCSMGSLIGGIYASGCPLDRLEDMARVFNDRHYIDFNVSVRADGYLKGDKVEELVEIMTEGISIEQSRIPFACLASCLETAEGHYFTSGPMYRAIRASISIPGIFAPVVMNGQTLVDGGVIDRSSLSALELLEPDFRIVCSVAYLGQKQRTPQGVREILEESYNILSWHAVRARLESADVQVAPDLGAFTGASFDDIGPIIDQGAKAAREMVPEIRGKLGLD